MSPDPKKVGNITFGVAPVSVSVGVAFDCTLTWNMTKLAHTLIWDSRR